jgi:hypothetical protein
MIGTLLTLPLLHFLLPHLRHLLLHLIKDLTINNSNTGLKIKEVILMTNKLAIILHLPKAHQN